MFQNTPLRFGEKFAVYAKFRSRLDRVAYNRIETPDSREVARIANGLEGVSRDVVILTAHKPQLLELGLEEANVFTRATLAFDEDRNAPLPDIILTDDDATTFRKYYQALGRINHQYAAQYAESMEHDPACRRLYLEIPKRRKFSEE